MIVTEPPRTITTGLVKFTAKNQLAAQEAFTHAANGLGFTRV
jgi:hypothetical protein